MLNTDSLSQFYFSLQALSVVEAILLYFLGYVVASIIKNLFGSEIATNFNLNKKVASGLIIAYLAVSPLNRGLMYFEQSSTDNVFSSALMTAFPIAVVLLIIFSILSLKTVMQIYFRVYSVLICLMRLNFNIPRTIKCYSNINFRHSTDFANQRPQYSSRHYLNHLVFHLPNYFIALILIANAASLGYLATFFIVGLTTIFIMSGLNAEFVSEEKNNWNSNSYSFGKQLHKVINLFQNKL